MPAPASFVDLPPNPPPTIELSILTKLAISASTGRTAGQSVVQYWTALRLDFAGFQQLLAVVRVDESLWSLFENEIAYEGDPKALPVLSPC